MERKPVFNYVLIFLIIIIAVLGIMGFMVMNRISTISNEAEKLVELDIQSGEIDTTIYSSGRYGVVESAMKSYIGNYVNNIRTLIGINSDQTIAGMLSLSNIIDDGPDFTKSKMYLESKRRQITDLETSLVSAGKEENIITYFETKGQNFFFNWIYKNQMLNNITLDFFYSEDEITSACSIINTMLDNKEAVLDFLMDNSENWKIENDSISFDTDELLEEYRELVARL